MDAAINRLGPKATGIDKLNHAQLKEKTYRTPLVKKLTFVFNKWWKGAEIPAYLKTARVVALSKDGTQRPAEGDIRTIAIAPQLTKVYEHVVHARLDEHITSKGLIHKTQRGFMKDQSTAHNLNDFIDLIESAKAREAQYRADKVKVADRDRTFILFIDLQKAFDRVDR